MRTTHLLWTGTAAVGPRQEVLTHPRQERPAGRGGRPGAGRRPVRSGISGYQPRRAAPHPGTPHHPGAELSGPGTTLLGMLIGAHPREGAPGPPPAAPGAEG